MTHLLKKKTNLKRLILLLSVAVLWSFGPHAVSASLVGATYDNASFSVNLQEISPTSLAFKSDGTKMYVVGVSGDRVLQYSLSTPWSLVGAAYDNVFFPIGGQEVNPTSLAFKSDGTKMYVVGTLNNTVFQYSLSAPWDLTGAVYDNISFNVGAEDTEPDGLAFKPDGTKMYFIGTVNDSVFQYSLPTPWDISGAQYDNVSSSVAAQDNGPSSLAFESDGAKMYVAGTQNNSIFQYSLPTPWDLTGVVYDNVSLNVILREFSPTGFAFKNTGTKMYVIGTFNDSVFQYSLPSNLALASVTVAPAAVTVEIGATVQFTADAFDQDGAPFAGATVAWTSGDAAVATVDANGLATGIAAGTATITASVTDGVNTVSGTSTIAVNAPAPVLITATLNLDAGWNLITLPIQPADQITGQPVDFTAESFGVSAGADVVTQWVSATQQYASHVVGLPIGDFPLTGGMGFFVHLPAAGAATLTGTPFASAAPAVSAGWNLLGWNQSSSTTADAFGLSIAGADSVTKWLSATQEFTSHIVNFPLNDFAINQGDGAFVHVP